MNEYFLILSLIGLAAFGMAWMPAISKIAGVSYSIIYLIADLIKHPASGEQLKFELLGYVLDSAHELDDIVREITLKAEEMNLSKDPE